jgi:uncharacterized protein
MSTHALALIVITLCAAIVNGGLGYGFSSITVPLALMFLTNRVLNPALVLIELVLNAYVLWVNRAAIRLVWRRIKPVVLGLGPGVMVGTLIVAQVHPDWLKLATYAVLLPLILVQAAGVRRPIRSEQSAGLALGGGIGALYAVTTISGPPLALALNNQGFSKQEFRAALAIVRVAESSFTAIAYGIAGLFVSDSLALVPQILPAVLVGVPIGTVLIRHVRPETFRRICMSFDAWIVSFGISTLLRNVHVIDSAAAYLVMLVVVFIDVWLLYRFFSGIQRPAMTYAA